MFQQHNIEKNLNIRDHYKIHNYRAKTKRDTCRTQRFLETATWGN